MKQISRIKFKNISINSCNYKIKHYICLNNSRYNDKYYRKLKIEKELNQDKFFSLHPMAHLDIMFTSNWITDRSKEALKPFGITHQQYNVLRILKEKHPEYCSADSIKEVMLDKSPDLTRLMDRLIEKEYVTRGVCEENRRKLNIGISDYGISLLKDIDPSMKEKHERQRKITQKEAIELSRILDKMRD